MSNNYKVTKQDDGREVIEVAESDKKGINAIFYAALEQARKEYPHVITVYSLTYTPIVSIPIIKKGHESHGNTTPVDKSEGAKKLASAKGTEK